MTPAARIAAAIDLIEDMEKINRPASEAIKAWGLAHRFAGSGDRSNVANLVYDTMRVRSSAQALLGSDTARASVIGMLKLLRGHSPEEIAGLFGVDRYAAPALTDGEREALAADLPAETPAHIAGNYPLWLDEKLERQFGADRVAEGKALATRAPLDLRVNALKALRPEISEALGHHQPEPTPHSPAGLRVPPRADGRVPYVQAEPAFIKGAVEVQDEGSQLAAQLCGAQPNMQVLDLCAGGGGKTLALAAAMNNRGQIFATDNDARRLRPIHERLERAGVRNVQIRTPAGRAARTEDLAGRVDLVVVDAPCTGTGTWRRNPDAKWRMRPGSLGERIKEQVAVLDTAAPCVKPGGRLVYITCSLLDEENGAQVEEFLSRHRDFALIAPGKVAADAGLESLANHLDVRGHGLLLSPRRTGTDGFFIATLERKG